MNELLVENDGIYTDLQDHESFLAKKGISMVTVLIVDDHPIMRLVLKAQLDALMGIGTILEASDGKSAIDITRKARPDLVILDLDLPKMSGLEVIPRLKKQHPSVRILIVSGQDSSAYAQRAAALGVHGFVSKAVDVDDILRSVEMVIAGYRIFPQESDELGPLPVQHGQAAMRLEQLSNKEMLVLQLLAKGLSNKMIAEELYISNKTVSSHKLNLMKKLNVVNLVELLDLARQLRVVP